MTTSPHFRLPRRSAGEGSPRLGIAAIVALLWSALLPPPAHAACQIQTLEMPIRMVGSRAVATVGINGTPVPLTVDSGAFYSMLTEAAAAQLKLQPRRGSGPRVRGLAGRVADTFVTRVEKLQVMDADISAIDFIVGGNEPGAGTMGLMGRNILSLTDTEYDLAHGVIRFIVPSDACATADMAYWAGTTPVTEVDLLSTSRDRSTAIRAQVKLNGTEFVAMFDTGATTLLTARAARRAGVADADMVPSGMAYGVGRGTVNAYTAPIEKFEIGGEVIRHNQLRVADFELDDADMLLGIDFFLSHRIYVSKQQTKMFFTYSGGDVFASGKGAAGSLRPAAADPAASGVPATTAAESASRGAAAASRRDYESALADFDRACALEPTSATFFAQRGAVHEALRHRAKALADFDKALELDPAQDDARFRRASLRFAAGDREGAKADLDALDKTLPRQAQMRLPMSQLYVRLDRPAESLAQLNAWLPAHPHEIMREVALNRRCWIRVTMGIELKEALDDCDDVVDGDGKNPEYLASRGWVHLRLGEYNRALEDFDRSIELRPTGAWSLYGRGLTRAKLGDPARGDEDLAAARKAMPEIDDKVAKAGLPAAVPR